MIGEDRVTVGVGVRDKLVVVIAPTALSDSKPINRFLAVGQ